MTKQRLYEALLKVRTMHDRELRDLYLSELESQLGHALDSSRHTDTRPDVRSLLNACMAHDGALRRLVTILRDIHGDTAQIREVERLVDAFEQQSSQPKRRLAEAGRWPLLGRAQSEGLARLVDGVRPELLATAYQHVVGKAPRDELTDWRDVHEVLAQLEADVAADDRDLVLLHVVDHLAHAVHGPTALKFHAWIDQVGTGLGFDQTTIRSLCTSTTADLARHAPTTGASSVSGDQSVAQESTLSDILHPPREDTVTQISALKKILMDQSERSSRIWGGVPIRNPDFTGREQMISLLRQALAQRSKASVLPETLHGLGGVGKTQLAVEYVYRHADHYDLVWWIPAEQPTSVRASLAQLGERLALPASEDMQQTAKTVLDVLSGPSPLRWLLVYDNADVPDDIALLLPGGSGGHVIVTSRNQEWSTVPGGGSIEVDVFERPESIELLRRRDERISEPDANMLAEKLGDLPLALEQAAIWLSANPMQVSEYLQHFDEHARELLDEGKPTYYPTTIYAFLRVALDGLREAAPGAAELLELFAFLGSDPLSTKLLRSGRGGGLSTALSDALAEPIALNRAIRELRRHGLAKVDPSGQTIQVHRLVQLVLREDLRADRRERGLLNVQRLLAAANPGFPMEPSLWPLYKEIGPHILPAHLINAHDPRARTVVLDQARYLHRVGDYEGSRELAKLAVDAWSPELDDGGLGPDNGLTLTAKRRLANALRQLGDYPTARELDEDTLHRLRANPEFGHDHEDTLATANSVALDLRLAGDFQAAYDLDQENLEKHRQVFGDEDQYTLTMKNNVAVNLRLLGDFQASYDIDRTVVEQWRQTLGPEDIRTLFSISNLARDLYGLGHYSEALDMQRQAWPIMRDQLGPRHNEVLLAARTIAITLRKAGHYEEALHQARENYRSYHTRFGPDHEHTLAATMSYANTLREINQWAEAQGLAHDAVERYTRVLGPRHPFTLAATTNLAIILRAVGDKQAARNHDEATLSALSDVLGKEHPYTLCVANNFANDLALDADYVAARELSHATLMLSRRVRGDRHPYTLACAVNAARHLQHKGDEREGQALLDEAVAALWDTLGQYHPDTVDAARGKRAECDIEPPPT